MFAIVIQASLGWKSILAAYHFSNFSFLEVIFQKILGTYYSSCIQEVQTHNCIKPMRYLETFCIANQI